MKIIANNYKANEIIKFIRENSGLTQEAFGNSIKKVEMLSSIMNMDSVIMMWSYY